MKYPTKQERKYQKYLHDISRNLRKTATNHIAQMTALLRLDSTDRQDLVEQMMDVYYNTTDKDATIDYLNEICSEVDTNTREELAKEFEEQTGSEIFINRQGEVFDVEWTALQQEHIEEVESGFWKKLALLLGLAFLASKPYSAIEEDINKLYKQTDLHCERIAINEISNLVSAKNRDYQQSMGVKYFHWQTEQDERVRKTHKSRNGKLYSWNKREDNYKGEKVYATDIFPGEEIMCRCIAVPVYESKV